MERFEKEVDCALGNMLDESPREAQLKPALGSLQRREQRSAQKLNNCRFVISETPYVYRLFLAMMVLLVQG